MDRYNGSTISDTPRPFNGKMNASPWKHKEPQTKVDPVQQPLMQQAFRAPRTDRHDAIIEVTHSAKVSDIGAGDLIRVDFTKNKVFCDGLYIMTYGGDSPDWIAIRRFQIIPDALRIYDGVDDVPYRVISEKEVADIRILGWIREVYKSSSC